MIVAALIAAGAGQAMLPSPAQTKLIETAIKSDLKDADSAKFRHTRFQPEKTGGSYCGYVNAKNSFGGYSGFMAFRVTFIEHEGKQYPIVPWIDDNKGYVEKKCREEGALP